MSIILVDLFLFFSLFLPLLVVTHMFLQLYLSFLYLHFKLILYITVYNFYYFIYLFSRNFANEGIIQLWLFITICLDFFPNFLLKQNFICKSLAAGWYCMEVPYTYYYNMFFFFYFVN